MIGRWISRRRGVAVGFVAASVALGVLAAPSCGKRSFLETSKGGKGEGESTGARASAAGHASAAPSPSSATATTIAALTALASAADAGAMAGSGPRLLVTNEDSGDVTII